MGRETRCSCLLQEGSKSLELIRHRGLYAQSLLFPTPKSLFSLLPLPVRSSQGEPYEAVCSKEVLVEGDCLCPCSPHTRSQDTSRTLPGSTQTQPLLGPQPSMLCYCPAAALTPSPACTSSLSCWLGASVREYTRSGSLQRTEACLS